MAFWEGAADLRRDWMTAWIVRAGVNGERDSWALNEGRAGGGFDEVPDITADHTRELVAQRVNSAFPGAHPQKIANFTGQLWALRSRIHQGDLIVLP
jgi:restriction system protein